MKVLFVGDTHMGPENILIASQAAIESDADMIIQVGDFGYTFDATEQGRTFLERVEQSTIPWYFIRGNHDSTEWILLNSQLDLLYGDEPEWVWENLKWIPDGCFMEIDGVTFAFQGGANSVDKWARTPHISWWPDESPVPLAAAGRTADVLVCHDIPDSLRGHLFTHLDPMSPKMEFESLKSRLTVEDYFQQVQPKIVIHGHYHIGYKCTTNETHIVGLSNDSRENSMWLFDTEYFRAS